MFVNVTVTEDKPVVCLADATLALMSLQQGRDYNGKIDCMTPAQYGGDTLCDT